MTASDINAQLEARRKKLASEPIDVPYENLHPDVRTAVDAVLASRKRRFNFTSLPAGWLTVVSIARTPDRIPDFITAAIGVATYKGLSVQVRRKSEGVADAMATAGAIDAAGMLHPDAVKKTHPYALIKQDGQLRLLPNTPRQNLVARLQGTWLRHLVPARWRVKV